MNRGRPSGSGTERRGGQPTVGVDYEFVAGKHFFTAATKLGRGLCVAHGDLETAFEEAGRQLRVILCENHGFELGQVERLAGFEELRRSLGAGRGRPARIASKRFELDWNAWMLVPCPS